MKNYFDFLATGDLIKDVKGYFFKYGKHDTYEHTLDVVNELYSIEKQFGRIETGSLRACYCHDLGRVVGNDEIIDFCIEHNIEVLDEERQLPSILHQKISCLIAERVFGINDKTVLEAIKYHTTSRKNPSMTEIEVFLADKLSWKEFEYKKLIQEMKEVMKLSKESAIFCYLSDLYNNREKLKVYHLDSKEAYEYFNEDYKID
ncbi:HD domain-containing protein [Clostridium estertheticum]|uniref:HD domain-containing protein n=1 Tax=Clostridium estertheticum TaxID=238834 RepID=UPI0013E97E81|nr:HD domain-containing protein [Clostridium estertheticum]MBZ9689347.1 HD domain-containing protein [Clostridium estertheticum]